jgi:hypothetical protein
MKLLNLKIVLIGIVILFIITLIAGYNIRGKKIESLRYDNSRLQENVLQLADENKHSTNLLLTKEEFIKVLGDSLKLTLHELKIKPKTITRVEERIVIQREIDTVKVIVTPLKKDTFLIHDEGPCFLWEGIAFLSHDSLNVRRINFSYHNKSTDIFHRVPKRKIWFIPIGKKIIQTSKSECGETVTREITVIK